MASVLDDYAYQQRTGALKTPATTTPNFITGEGVPGVKVTPTPAPTINTAAQDAAELADLKKQVAEIAAQTGQKVDPRTGQIIIDETAIAKKFGAESKPVVVPPVDSAKATQDLLLAQQARADEEAKLRDRQSAYDILYNEFNKYGLGGLVEDIKSLIQSNLSPSQFSIELQNRPAYQARFSANKERIAQGLRALTPAEYVGLEDQYQNIMRNYGLPASYYTKDATGKQAGFDKFLAGDVSASELEDRIATAQQRVLNSNPEVLTALKQFYPDISNADILAYTLDPSNALTNIKRKVTAAEIGGAALAQGLQAQGGTAESLAGQGITKAQAQQGYTEIAGMLPRASQLSDIYNQGPYTQGTAEAEVFNTAGAAAAKKKREKLTSLETAAFSGSSGVGALGRDKAIYGGAQGQAGLY
jgi:hypothetical protein